MSDVFTYLKTHAEVAQLVEQLICNQQVVGSTPFLGSSRAVTRVAKWGGL